MPSLVLLVSLLATSGPAADRRAAAAAIADGTLEQAKEAESLLLAAGQRGLWALSAELKHRPGADARGRLLRAVGRFGSRFPEPTLWLLRVGLRSSAPEVRRGAIEGLRRSNLPRRRSVLLHHLDEPDPAARRALAAAAAELGSEAREALEARLEDASPAAREVATRALARILEGEAQRTLLARALIDPSAEVRRAGIELAAVTRDPSHAAALRTLAHRGDVEEAELAAKALAHLPGRRAALAQLLADPEAPLSAVRVAFDRLRRIRRHALDLLLPPLLGLSEARREALAEPLLEAPREEEIRDLVELIDHPNPSRARLARAWLARIGPRADEAAARALLDARPVRAEAIRTYLASRPGGGVTDGLMAQAASGHLDARVEAIGAIGALGTPRVREKLVGLLGDPAPTVRAAAAAVVGDLEPARTSLLVLAVDPAPTVRAAAVGALARQFGELPWRARLEALRDEDPRVRLAAIRTFEGTAHPEAIARLENRVLLGTRAERVAAVTAIARSPTTEAAVKLVELVAHRDPEVRRAALSYVDSL